MPHAEPEPAPRRLLSAVIQLVGFAVGLGLLAWIVRIALKPENREQLAKLSDASPGQLVALFALTAATITLNGLVFWVLIRPVKPLKVLDVVAVNALATGLSYVPFKMSLVARFAIHRLRDGLPIATIGAWIIADIGTIAATLGPILAISIWRQGIDEVWLVAVIVSVFATNVALVFAGRLLEGERGLERIRRALSLTNLHRLADGPKFSQAHLGMSMIARVRAITLAMVFRVGDISVLAARFLVAAAVLGLDLSITDATLLGIMYFAFGAASPSGEAGAREAGTIGFAALMNIAPEVPGGSGADQANPVLVLTLLVSATELVIRIVAAVFSVVWLRADKLITPNGRRERAAGHGAGTARSPSRSPSRAANRGRDGRKG